MTSHAVETMSSMRRARMKPTMVGTITSIGSEHAPRGLPGPSRDRRGRSLSLKGCLPTALALVSACGTHLAPIPTGERPPWVEVFTTHGFRIALDTAHVTSEPGGAVLLWFITFHEAPQMRDSIQFDRGRIRLLVRCNPLGLRSVSQELALGSARPSHQTRWTWSGPAAPAWREPAAGTTDAQFLARACTLLSSRRT